MANGDVVRLTLIGNNEGVYVINTFHYMDRSGGSTVIDAATAAHDWWTANTAALVAGSAAATNFTSVVYTCIAGPGTGNQGVYVIPPYAGGSQGGQQLPQEIAIAVWRNTGKVGRAQRGRLFWGPVTEDFFTTVDTGQVLLGFAALAALIDMAKGVFTTQTVGLESVLVSKTKVPTATAIINAGVSPECVHRRSRRLRSPS